MIFNKTFDGCRILIARSKTSSDFFLFVKRFDDAFWEFFSILFDQSFDQELDLDKVVIGGTKEDEEKIVRGKGKTRARGLLGLRFDLSEQFSGSWTCLWANKERNQVGWDDSLLSLSDLNAETRIVVAELFDPFQKDFGLVLLLE